MLSLRCKEKNAWFLEAFKRPLGRQGSSDPSTIDLATAENWLIRPAILPLLKKGLSRSLEEKHLSYASGLGGTPQLLNAISIFLNGFFSPKVAVQPEQIVTGAGCSALLDTLLNDICDAGDGVLVTAPFWGSFEVSAVLRNSVRLIPVFVSVDESGSAEAVVAAYRRAAERADCKVRGILFCNPHNPHGHICPVEVLDGLLRYCEEADIHFVSDEIYALSTFGYPDSSPKRRGKGLASPADEFVSVLSRDLTALGVCASRVHMLYSISKDFGCSGIRLGCLVTQCNRELRMSQAIHNNARLCSAAAVMLAPILGDPTSIAALIKLSTDRLRRAAAIAVAFAEFHGLDYYEPVAGLYIWLRLAVDCDTEEREEKLVQRCVAYGVLIGSGADYAEPRAGWFRLTFSLPQDRLLEALRRLEDAVGYIERFEWETTVTWRSVVKSGLAKLCSIPGG